MGVPAGSYGSGTDYKHHKSLSATNNNTTIKSRNVALLRFIDMGDM
jgi:hypothetical protein